MIVNNSIVVVLPLPIDKTFNYAVNSEEFNNIYLGSRVVVSFGKKKLYTAIVIDKLLNENYDYELKEIEFIVDESPCINKHQIEFYNWISKYYMCPIGKVYETALPKLFLIKSETVININSNVESKKISNKALDLYNSISDFKQISLIDLIKLYGKESVKLVNELVINNCVSIHEEIYDTYIPKTKIFYQLNTHVKESSSLRSINHKNITDFFLNKKLNFQESRENLINKFNVTPSVLNLLVKNNILVKKKIQVDRFDHNKSENIKSINLSVDQKKNPLGNK